MGTEFNRSKVLPMQVEVLFRGRQHLVTGHAGFKGSQSIWPRQLGALSYFLGYHISVEKFGQII